MPFPNDVVRRAWVRQGGRCARCGKRLVRGNRDRGEVGAWHAHHRRPDHLGGTETLRNCVILCITPPNCHWTIGHGGISWNHHEPLRDSELPYLYYGRKPQRHKKRQRKARPMPQVRLIRL